MDYLATGGSGLTREPGRPHRLTRRTTSTSHDPRTAVLDTSVLIARESGRPLDSDRLPAQGTVTVIAMAELHAGILAASDDHDPVAPARDA